MQNARRCYKVLHNQPESHFKNQFNNIMIVSNSGALCCVDYDAWDQLGFSAFIYKGAIVPRALVSVIQWVWANIVLGSL